MKHKLLLLVIATFATIGCAVAQDRIITGKVTDMESGESLPGVTVMVQGTSTGAATDIDGNFSLSVKEDAEALVFSFIGYETEEVPIGNRSVINVELPPNIQALSEVVVIGFGTREKKDLTGSISTVSAKDIEAVPFASPEFALQGKAPGVRVVNSSGNPSEGPQIFIRGVGSWVGSAQPLYVIDGQIITPPSAGNQDVIGNVNLWTLVNPNDIESISVLKDASAAAVYGSRGANGVILITTKRGKKGRPVVEFNSRYGVQNTPTFDVLNSSEVIGLSREMYRNNANPDVTLEKNLYGREEENEIAQLNNFHPQLDPESPFYIGEDPRFYDWQDAIRRNNAVSQNYDVKVSGASEAANYYVSLGYTQQEGVLKGNSLERYNVAANINTDVGKYIKTGLNYKLAYQESEENNAMQLQEAASTPPWQPIYDPNNFFGFAPARNLYDSEGNWQPYKMYGSQTRHNALAFMNVNDRQFNLLRNTGQAYAEIEPINNLTIRGSLSLDYTYQQRVSFNDILAAQFSTTEGDPAEAMPAGSYGRYGLRTNKFLNYQADLTTNYSKRFGLHSFNAMFSIQDQHFKGWNEDIGTRNAQTRDRNRLGVTGSDPETGGFSYRQEKFWFGYVGRLSYDYDSRYYLDLSYRRDGSSGFPEDKRWGNFYSASGAWRISEESFMQNISFINDLKLRGGWGQAGNDENVVGRFAYLSGVSNMGSYAFGSGLGDPVGNYLISTAIRDFPNTNFTWETVTTSNIGFDALLFKNRINATVEFFSRRTDDILQTVDVPLSVGTGSPVFNIGSARNMGVELDMGYNGKIGDFTYNVSGNISFLRNEVLSMYDDRPINTGFGRVEVGRPIGHIWGYQLGGIFQTQEEIDAYFETYEDETIQREFVQPGDMYFLDVQGNPTDEEPFYSSTPDGKINAFDMTQIGNTIPGHTYGLNLSAGYKGLDFNVNFYGEGDVDKVNQVRQGLEAMTAGGLNQMATVRDRWTPENPSTTMPRAVAGDPAGNNRFSSRWVENAGFFRLNTWQLGYSLPSTILEKTAGTVSRFRVYVSGQNNMLITNWQGLDPVNDRYPLPRSFFFGINASF